MRHSDSASNHNFIIPKCENRLFSEFRDELRLARAGHTSDTRSIFMEQISRPPQAASKWCECSVSSRPASLLRVSGFRIPAPKKAAAERDQSNLHFSSRHGFNDLEIVLPIPEASIR